MGVLDCIWKKMKDLKFQAHALRFAVPNAGGPTPTSLAESLFAVLNAIHALVLFVDPLHRKRQDHTLYSRHKNSFLTAIDKDSSIRGVARFIK